MLRSLHSVVIICLGLLFLWACQSNTSLNQSLKPTAQAVPEQAFKWQRELYAKITVQDFRHFKPFVEQIDFQALDYPRLNAAIFYVTNETRQKHNLPVLAYAAELECAAWNHARRMVEKNFFSHTDPTDSKRQTPELRGRLAGIANPYLAENIADCFAINYDGQRGIYPLEKQGQFSYTWKGKPIPPHTYLSLAEEVVNIWMNSSGHQANILSKQALQLGCGAYFYYDANNLSMPKFKVVQNFQWFKEIIKANAQDTLP